MWLDLSYRCDNYREYLVMHEFGHVLGLGHDHQMSHLAKALDKKAVIKCLRRDYEMSKESAKRKFEADYKRYSKASAPKYLEGIEFDPWSVMCYP